MIITTETIDIEILIRSFYENGKFEEIDIRKII